MPLDFALKKLLVCPQCRGELEERSDGTPSHALFCASCNMSFPVRDGLPVMLIEEATFAQDAP